MYAAPAAFRRCNWLLPVFDINDAVTWRNTKDQKVSDTTRPHACEIRTEAATRTDRPHRSPRAAWSRRICRHFPSVRLGTPGACLAGGLSAVCGALANVSQLCARWYKIRWPLSRRSVHQNGRRASR
eukprot:scaffold347_cov239-Pinguiococcus_pyrenoidosus.AAC.41